MTFQEQNKKSNDLFCRNNLTFDQTINRLEKHFAKQKVLNIMQDVDAFISWTNGDIVVICTDKINKTYSIVASGIYMDLIEL